MKRRIFLYLLVLLSFQVKAQSYNDKILQFRAGYEMSLMKGIHPLKAKDTGYLKFYKPDTTYRAKATFVQVTGKRPFRLQTKNGGIGPEVTEYGVVYFNMNGGPVTLHVYRIVTKPDFRMLARTMDDGDESELFIPFTDRTNYKETFGGGRYLDVNAASLVGGNVIIDFNKACNPHTAYEKHYPYIIPPSNNLPIEIKAGEKIFGHNPGY